MVQKNLTARQKLFVAEYLIDHNAKAAAIRAGYSAKTATQGAGQLMQKPIVRAAIDRAVKKLTKKIDVTVEQVVAELAKIGFANMADYMRVGPSGDPVLDFSKLNRDQSAALSEVTVEDFVDGRGEDARDVRRVKFKLADKRAALVDLGKHLKMFVEKHEHTGKDGAPIFIVTGVPRGEK